MTISCEANSGGQVCAGLDVGSRTIKLVIMDTAIRDTFIVKTGVDPLRGCKELLSGKHYSRLVVTGYGRHLVAPNFGGETVSEIKAFALGARCLFPDCHTVIDIGGQDSKAIRLSESGEIQKFEMNDRCAAGTGKFLEVMAQTLEINIDEISELALSAQKKVQINNLCTVFAESEVISLIAKGEEASAIALALHEAIATRIVTLVKRVGINEKTVFAGGAALNQCLARLLEQKLNLKLVTPNKPQIIGALGAALLAINSVPKIYGT